MFDRSSQPFEKQTPKALPFVAKEASSHTALIGKAAGFNNLDKSRPFLQGQYWLRELLIDDSKCIISSSRGQEYRQDTYSIMQAGGKKKDISIYYVAGEHAWHGGPGGLPGVGMPLKNFPLSKIVADYIKTHKIEHDLK